MNYPKIAIVGRPNVGKSSLFNRLLKKRVSIVNEEEGVTRDRLYGDVEYKNSYFTVIDTAGLIHSEETMKRDMLEQTLLAIEEADACFFTVDACVGVTLLDEEVAKIIRKSGKPTVVVVNKVDDDGKETLIHPFHALGFSKTLPVSSAHDRGIYEILEAVAEELKIPASVEDASEGIPSVSIVGRTNVGKSTLLNALAQQKRSIVSPEVATTRDPVEILVSYRSHDYRFIDTAGLRRKQKEENPVEKFASLRTFDAIKRGDICLMVIDAVEGMRSREKKILSEIYEMGKPCIVLLNKWDIVDNFRMEHVRAALVRDCPHLEHYPVLFVSALTGRNLEKIYPLIDQMYTGLTKKAETSDINAFFEEALSKQHPPLVNGKRLRIYYATQVKGSPPTFLLFVNRASYLTPNYRSFLINRMRERFHYVGTPIHFLLKGKPKKTDSLS